jgi:hypothetical protein
MLATIKQRSADKQSAAICKERFYRSFTVNQQSQSRHVALLLGWKYLVQGAWPHTAMGEENSREDFELELGC